MNIYRLLLLIMIPTLLMAQVTIRDTTIVWHTFKYDLNEDHMMNWNTNTQYDTVSKTFSGVVLENEYLKVTLVPEFGGRILSMIYKPTGKEELYQNPAGAPYGIGQDWFYYKWLMVYGGIFPTLPEPEHGKAWLLPWDFKILKETADTVRCQMSWRDTVQLQGINLSKWKYGKTNIKCDFTLTLVRGASALEADLALYNDAGIALDYEYWTCLTLAPGSEPGDPKCTQGAKLIIPASKIKIPSWYSNGIAKQEKVIDAQNGIYTLDNLRYWKNWTNDGIAYPWEDTNENFWGVINHDNEEGIIRIADNNITTGIKIWAWGYQQSQNINPFNSPFEVHRPYVELWAGHSNEFFAPAQIAMNSTKQWKEIYVPTIGLSNVTNANDEIIADFKVDSGKTVNLGFVTTRPKNHFDVSIGITGQNSQVLKTQTIIPDPVNGNRIMTDLPANQTWSKGDSLVCTITDSDNGCSLTTSIPLDNITTEVTDLSAIAKDFQLYQNYPNPFNANTTIEYRVGIRSHVLISIFNVLGEKIETVVNTEKTAGTYRVNWTPRVSSGIYYYKLEVDAGSRYFTDYKKLILIK